MRWKRRLLRGLLAASVIFDLLIFLEIRRHGWPSVVSGRTLANGAEEIFVNRSSFTVTDWLVTLLLVVIQIAIVYGNWRIARGLLHPTSGSGHECD